MNLGRLLQRAFPQGRPSQELQIYGSGLAQNLAGAFVPIGDLGVISALENARGLFEGSTKPSWYDSYLSFPGGGTGVASVSWGSQTNGPFVSSGLPNMANLAYPGLTGGGSLSVAGHPTRAFSLFTRVFWKGGSGGPAERTDVSARGWHWGMDNTKCGLSLWADTTLMDAYAGAPAQNKWINLAVVAPYNAAAAASTVKVYFDGVLQTLGTTVNAVGNLFDDSTIGFELGRHQFAASGAAAGTFNGYMDVFYAWKRALTSDEVQRLVADPYMLFRPTVPTFYMGSVSPVISSLSPNQGQQGVVSYDIAVVGANNAWVNGTTVASFSGTGITVNSTTVSDANHAIVNVTIAGGATVGARDIVMTTGGVVTTGSGLFTVHAASSIISKARVAFQYTVNQYTNVPGQLSLRRKTIQIREVMNNTPNQCTFMVDGQSDMPQVGATVTIEDPYDSNRILFAGTIQSVQQDFEGYAPTSGENPSVTGLQQLVWSVTAVDFTFLLNSRRPFGSYQGVSASDVVKDIVTRFCPGFTAAHVQTNLAQVTANFDGTQDVATVLNAIAAAIGGGHWYVDYSMDVHFFHIIPPTLPVLNNPDQGITLGAAPLTLSDGGPIPNVQNDANIAGYYSYASTFVYDDGTESQLSQWSNFVAMDVGRVFSFSNIPIGAAVGGHTCVKRRLYAMTPQFGSPASRSVGKSAMEFFSTVEIGDNTTTSFSMNGSGLGVVAVTNCSSTAVTIRNAFGTALPQRIYVPPPAGPTQASVASQSASFLQFPQFPFAPQFSFSVVVNSTPGWFVFQVAYVYRDGTVSLPGPVSNIMFHDGIHDVDFNNLPIGPNIGAADVIARVVYYEFLQFSFSTTPPAVTPPLPPVTVPFNIAQSANGFAFVPNNTTVKATPVGQGNTFVPYEVNPSAGAVTSASIWPHQDGPSLENYPAPDPIDGLHSSLLNTPQIISTSDISQVRNRVFIRGAGSSLTKDAIIGATQVSVADVAPFVGAGQFLMAGTVYTYLGANGPTGAGTVFLDPSKPLTALVPQGTGLNNWFQADDFKSQTALATLVKDVNGNATSGVYEYTIVDTTLTSRFQMYVRAMAELELFAQPIVTIKYTTSDKKTRIGLNVHVDLTDPPIQGDFLIQDITIDHIHDQDSSATSTPWYNVTASTVKYNLSDLLLQILQPSAIGSSSGGGSSLNGVIAASTTQDPVGSIVPAASRRNFAWVNATPNLATHYEVTGLTGPGWSATGDAAFVDERRAWRRHTTSVQGTAVGANTSNSPGVYRFAHKPYFAARVRTGSSLVNARIWVGMSRICPTNSGADLPPNNDGILWNMAAGQGGDGASNRRACIFRFSPASSGWVPIVSDGLDNSQAAAGGATTGQGTIGGPVGPSVAINTEYLLEISIDPPSRAATFTVTDVTNAVAPAAAVMSMPTTCFGNPFTQVSTDQLVEHLFIAIYSNDGNNKYLDVGGVYTEWGIV